MTKKSSDTIIPPEDLSLAECPNCGFQRYVKIPRPVRESNARSFDLTCECGHSSSVMIEKRKFRRHAFNTDGSILVRGKKGQHEKVLIRLKDLSRSGVKFTTQKRPHLETDERIIISLNFNDNQHTAFVKEAAVKSIDDNYIRAEFYSLCGDVAALKQQKP